jgi:hypothetical protein
MPAQAKESGGAGFTGVVFGNAWVPKENPITAGQSLLAMSLFTAFSRCLQQEK